MSINSYEAFLEAAKIDLEAARILAEKCLCAPAIYHLQQSFEKCLKSFHVFKATIIEGTSVSQAHSKATKYSHDIEKSVIELLVDITQWEMQIIRNAESSGPEFERARSKVLHIVNGYITTIRNMPERLQLESNIRNNIEGYENHVEYY